MTLNSRNLQWRLTAVDGSGSSGLMKGSFAPGTGVDQGLLALVGLIDAIKPLSGCTFVRRAVSISQFYTPKPLPVGPTPVNQAAAWFFETDAAGQFCVFSFGGAAQSLAKGTGCNGNWQIDTADTRFSPLLDAITSGPWCNPFGHDITAAVSAHIRLEG